MIKGKSVCEEGVYKMVFDQHAETIRNFIYYKCGNMQQAEDITQDAFIKLWRNCKKVLIDKAKSFVMKVAQNAFFNEINHQKVVLQYQEKAPLNIYSESPDFLLEEKEFKHKLKRSIADLPSKQREVFLLNRLDKKTYKEIAEIVGITQKAVERRMHLALLELKNKIGTKI
ncbi:MAG: sigma-70 family RNA polymerase sigma factor [Marinifilum sp.]|jgi:RNA polymerase sigma-70 factor (ECF subfamily)|nr:sigma-70 family RNA polymerase sigma factor [Marinifilum sp.]